jgi:hypothetical protein
MHGANVLETRRTSELETRNDVYLSVCFSVCTSPHLGFLPALESPSRAAVFFPC